MCTASILGIGDKPEAKKQPEVPSSASDVPLGTGLADVAKTSILSRREQIRRAVEGAQ